MSSLFYELVNIKMGPGLYKHPLFEHCFYCTVFSVLHEPQMLKIEICKASAIKRCELHSYQIYWKLRRYLNFGLIL